MRKSTRGALVVLATVLVAFAGAEAWLRAFHPVEHRMPLDPSMRSRGDTTFHQRSSVPGLPCELIPGMSGIYANAEVSINSLGMRGPEVERAKAPGTFRVVAIGDSLTFGYGAPQSGTWPAALERILARDPEALGARAVQVLDLGVSGYNSKDDARVLETKALELDPDLVVVGYFLNDPQAAPIPQLQRWFRTPDLWERSHLLRLVDGWLQARAKARHGNDAYFYLHDPDSDGWEMVLRAFDSMARTSREHQLPVVVATLPAFPPGPTWDGYRWEVLHARVLDAARASGLDAIDTLPEFRTDGRRPKDLAVDFEHPNAEGAEIIARAVAAEVRRIAGKRGGEAR